MKHAIVASLLSVAYLIGQIAPWGELAKVLSEFGVLGVLIWYLWQTHAKTLPHKDKHFAAQAALQRTHDSEQLNKVVKEMQAGREAHQGGMEKLSTAMNDLRVQCERRGD